MSINQSSVIQKSISYQEPTLKMRAKKVTLFSLFMYFFGNNESNEDDIDFEEYNKRLMMDKIITSAWAGEDIR